MAGLFMCLAFPRGLLGLLGFDLGSQSWIPLLPLLPSELHLGSLCFQQSSIWDFFLDSLASS